MKLCWMFVILVGCKFAQAATSPSACACKDEIKSVCLPVGRSVHVPCPQLTGDVSEFKLLKDQKMIYNHTSCKESNMTQCTPPYTRSGVEMHQNAENKSVSFVLTGLSPSSHGLYKCEGVVMFPPPYLDPTPGPVRILVLIQGHQCRCDDCTPPDCPGKTTDLEFPWIWILVILSVIYGLIMSILALVFWLRQKNPDAHSDYMNTKPRPVRERKKNRGVQNPAPRYF